MGKGLAGEKKIWNVYRNVCNFGVEGGLCGIRTFLYKQLIYDNRCITLYPYMGNYSNGYWMDGFYSGGYYDRD